MAQKEKDYIVVISHDYVNLEARVSEKLNEGYECAGGIFIFGAGLHQSMVK